MSAPDFKLAWVAPAAGPFGLEYLDCRAVTLAVTSVTSDRSVAESFTRLRNSGGSHLQGQSMDGWVVAPGELSYPVAPPNTCGAWFLAGQMEDKWDCYAQDERLYFSRSWTGSLCYFARWKHDGNALHIRSISGPETTSVDHIRRTVDFLIRSHVFGLAVPHPVIPVAGASDDDIALGSFSTFGRFGWFASFGDTCAAPPAGTLEHVYRQIFGY